MDGSKKEKFRDDPPPPPDIEWTEMTRAIAQIVLGNLMVVGGAGSISYYCYLCYVSTGIWVGITVLAAGVIGVIDAARESYGLRRAYFIFLITSMTFSLALFGVEVAGYVFDSRYCDKPFRNATTTSAPPSLSPSPPQYTTHSHGYPVEPCRMECVYIHAGLGTFGILDIAAAAVCIYYTLQGLKKALPLPYKAMMAEPIPYKSMT